MTASHHLSFQRRSVTVLHADLQPSKQSISERITACAPHPECGEFGMVYLDDSNDPARASCAGHAIVEY